MTCLIETMRWACRVAVEDGVEGIGIRRVYRRGRDADHIRHAIAADPQRGVFIRKETFSGAVGITAV